MRLIGPPAGVRVGVQEGKGSAGRAVLVRESTGEDIEFALSVLADPVGPRFGGPFIQKDSKGPFVYMCWGTIAGQAGSCWTRRTKVYLSSATGAMVEAAFGPGRSLRATLAGTAKDGGPACASVPVQIDVG